MDLWIRSQDRTKLMKINEVEFQEDDYGFYIFAWKDKFEGSRTGKYKTKERALEVLDEIQKLLIPKMIIKNEGRDCVALDGTIYRTNIVSNINSDIQQLSTYVYEMPKE